MLVCIPSKARPNTQSYKLYESVGLKFCHFIEPQDQASYEAARVPNLIVLPANNQGLAFVRNHIVSWAKSNGVDWIWMNDDDVKGFGIAIKGKTINKDARILVDIYDVVHKYKYPLNGLNYAQHAWSYSNRPRYFVNKRPVEVCSLLYIPKITWKYRGEMDTKEDRDFCMQAIQNSNGLIISTHHWFACPTVGTNKGGLQPLYAATKDHAAALLLRDTWAPYSTMVKKGDRVDCKLLYSDYAKSLGRTVKP
jgi:hypothetical protein